MHGHAVQISERGTGAISRRTNCEFGRGADKAGSNSVYYFFDAGIHCIFIPGSVLQPTQFAFIQLNGVIKHDKKKKSGHQEMQPER